jgi:hypothetical protein
MTSFAPAIESNEYDFAERIVATVARLVGRKVAFSREDLKILNEMAAVFEELIEEDMVTYIARTRSAFMFVTYSEACAHALASRALFEELTTLVHTEESRRVCARLTTAAIRLSAQLREGWELVQKEAREDPLIAHIVASVDGPPEEMKRREAVIFQAHRIRRKHAETFKLLA